MLDFVGRWCLMLTLQEQVLQRVDDLSEDNLRFLLDMIERFMLPDTVKKRHR